MVQEHFIHTPLLMNVLIVKVQDTKINKDEIQDRYKIRNSQQQWQLLLL